ncbi:molybdenum cofactor guanylyltransferase [Corynebacterium sp. H130]|uniref:molybdenum cofactor guanylyltransferase n=1 Tax=Corynebacterium sp. H130 TaxID=3133444 RepID=UPI0030B03DB2
MFDLIILGGGRASRMGGGQKLARLLHGRRLIDWLLADAHAIGARPIVVAPDDLELESGISRALEDPPFGGPVAGIAAALALCRSELVGIVGGDAPLAARVLPVLADQLGEHDAVLAQTPDGQRQQLLAVIRREALERAVAALDTPRDKSVRAMYRGLDCGTVDVPAWTMDADSPADLAQLSELSRHVIASDELG